MDKEEIYFIRWGNLNPVKHKEARNRDEDSYHVAPVVYGIYAFPRGYIEKFLTSGSFTNHSKKFLEDENGNKILANDFWDWDEDKREMKIFPKYKKLVKKLDLHKKDFEVEYIGDEDNGDWYISYLVKPHKFKYTGELWHHLGDYVDRRYIIETKDSWVKTDFKTYCKALHKCDTLKRFESYMGPDKNYPRKNRSGDPHTYARCCSKDHYEVFIEKIK